MTHGRELELRLHMKGTPIRTWRGILKRCGYTLSSYDSESFDLEVEDATKRFQRDHSLPETGIVDARTLEAAEMHAARHR